MTVWFLKQLRRSELGWFKACRRAGTERGKQRGLNLPFEVVEVLRGPGPTDEIPVVVSWFDGHQLRSDIRPIRKQAKNWRLVGPAIEGVRFASAGGGDLIVLKIEPGRQHTSNLDSKLITKGVRGFVTWDLLPQGDVNSLDEKLPAHMLTVGFRAGIRRLTEREAGELVEAAHAANLLTSFPSAALLFWPTNFHHTLLVADLFSSPANDQQPTQDQLAHVLPEPEPVSPSPEPVDTWAEGAQLEETELPPNGARLIEALRAIGYTFPQAIADLIDNSINAEASTVLVRLLRANDNITQVIIADDGQGMTEQRLHEAMRFGSDTESGLGTLGKYGLGMKLASLSRCRQMTVASSRGGRVSGRRWSIEKVQINWTIEHLTPALAASVLNGVSDRLQVQDHGTVVLWEDLDRIPTSGRQVKRVVKWLIDDLEHHLGMCFHRFLEKDKLRIIIDSVEAGREPHSVVREVKPRNPFGYDRSGDDSYPKTFEFQIPNHVPLQAVAHVWPAQQSGRNYKLDGKVNDRQGFYFYRNDRLIQAGGWNSYRKGTEPHLSLARVSIDLPAELDSIFSLDVKKSGIREPPSFPAAVRDAQTRDGEQFAQYLKRAQNLYRRQSPTYAPVIPVPGAGVSAEVAARIQSARVPNEDGAFVERVDFLWSSLADDEVVFIDPVTPLIVLNSKYREILLEGAQQGENDLPLVKLALLVMAEESIEKGTLTKTERDRLAVLNMMLLTWIKETNGD